MTLFACRPENTEICPPRISRYSLSWLDTASIRPLAARGGTMLSCEAATTSNGWRMLRRSTRRPRMVNVPLSSLQLIVIIQLSDELLEKAPWHTDEIIGPVTHGFVNRRFLIHCGRGGAGTPPLLGRGFFMLG